MTSEIVVFLGLRISLTVFDKKFLSLMLLQLLREDLVVLPYLPKFFDHYLHLLFLLPNALKIGIVFIGRKEKLATFKDKNDDVNNHNIEACNKM